MNIGNTLAASLLLLVPVIAAAATGSTAAPAPSGMDTAAPAATVKDAVAPSQVHPGLFLRFRPAATVKDAAAPAASGKEAGSEAGQDKARADQERRRHAREAAFQESCNQNIAGERSPYKKGECQLKDGRLVLTLTPRKEFQENVRKLDKKDSGSAAMLCGLMNATSLVNELEYRFLDDGGNIIQTLEMNSGDCGGAR